jgi:hypothetical protein
MSAHLPAVVRSLCELSVLWARPPDPNPGNETAPVATRAADTKNRLTLTEYAAAPRRARGRP